MAANYWTSTQRRFWFFSREKLAAMRERLEDHDRDIAQQYPLPDRRLINIYLKDQLLRLARRLPTRQQCIATTMVYIHRYLLHNTLRDINPYLLLSTAFYLASKTEESPHHIRLVLSEVRQLWPEFIPSDVSRLGEMEFSLISEMRSQLIIWHPYRTLIELKDNPSIGLTNEEVSLAWSIINDTFMTDLPLTCPPHVIAIMAIFLAVVFQPNKASLGLHSLPQQSLPSTPSPGGPPSFQSLGGRSGLASSLNNAMGAPANPNMSQSTQSPMKPASTTGGVPAAKAKAMAATFSSDRIQRMVTFLAESEISIEQMIGATQEVISLYEVWEQYSEKGVKENIVRYVRVRGLDK